MHGLMFGGFQTTENYHSGETHIINEYYRSFGNHRIATHLRKQGWDIEVLDYSWAFFFLSLGIFFLKKNYFELAVIFFGISIGTRINFVLFVPFIIFFFSYENFLSIYRKLILFFCLISFCFLPNSDYSSLRILVEVKR